jgi:hypothetical protein
MCANFGALKHDRKSGARRRAMQFAFQHANERPCCPQAHENPGHADAERAAPNDQTYKLCKPDPAALWQPANSHRCSNCHRRGEPLNGSKHKTIYTLQNLFWQITFGLSRDATRKLRIFRDFTLPVGSCTWRGRRTRDKARLVEARKNPVPRHYSHFSMTSTHEHVDCASSALDCW